MRPFSELISVAEAREIVGSTGTPLGRRDRVALGEAHRRVLAEDIVSPRDVPPFARAAMDGYAVRAEDTTGASRSRAATLRVKDTIYTGQTASDAVGAGECFEIATGAPIPPGADAVVMVEETDRDSDGTVRIFTSARTGQHIGRQGTDIQSGQTVLSRGDRLTASRLGTVAAMGYRDIDVFGTPRVAIASTGNEIVEPGRTLAPGQLYDVNRYTLASVVNEHGGLAAPRGVVPDTLDALDAALDDCLTDDLVILSGGTSVGERDLIVDAVSRRGRVLFHGIAVKPGKPTLFGMIDDTPIFGLSGYPTSCLVNAYVLVVPLLRRLAHLPAYEPRRASLRLARPVTSVAGRRQFLTVRVDDDLVHPTFKGSGDITSMAQADGYVEVPESVEILEEGATVEVVFF
jgi:molybdenum cofactor synthesis domain-containing protein